MLKYDVNFVTSKCHTMEHDIKMMLSQACCHCVFAVRLTYNGHQHGFENVLKIYGVQ